MHFLSLKHNENNQLEGAFKFLLQTSMLYMLLCVCDQGPKIGEGKKLGYLLPYWFLSNLHICEPSHFNNYNQDIKRESRNEKETGKNYILYHHKM